jgi:prepilin-type N-terminal cleavage/methylation domain-containing protein
MVSLVRTRLFPLLRDRARDQRGVTLVEVIVVVSLLTVVLGSVTAGFVSIQNAAAGASLRLQNLEEARVLMDAVSRDIRTAARMTATTSPFDVGASSPSGISVPVPGFGHAAPYTSATEVWFFANLTLAGSSPNPCPDVVHLFVDTAASPPVLKEQVLAAAAGGTPPSCSYSGSYSTRLLGKYVANSGSQPVFTYYYDDAAGTPTAFSTALNPLSSANRLQVTMVGITMAIRQSTNYNVPYTTLVNRVRLPNVDYNPLPSPSP